MKTCVHWAAGAALLVGLATTGAEALPLTSPSALPDAGPVTLVSDGCGPFGHRSHFGYCKPNGGGFYGRPGYGPPGYGPPGFFRPPPRRCFVRYTYFGPRRFCR